MKRISDFMELLTANDDDLLLIWDSQSLSTKSIKISSLKTLFGTGEGTGTSTNIKLSYSFDGDTSGLFYFIGTEGRKTPWQNPHTAGFIQVTMSSVYASDHNNPHYLVDRQVNANIATQHIKDSWYKINLGNYKLQPNFYSIRARNYPSSNIRNWKLQASNDDVDWIDLDIQINNGLSQNQWFSKEIPITSNYYKYFRLLQTDYSTSNDYYFCPGELELYGTVK